eukprot:4835627-Prymnesium_polylepis.2
MGAGHYGAVCKQACRALVTWGILDFSGSMGVLNACQCKVESCARANFSCAPRHSHHPAHNATLTDAQRAAAERQQTDTLVNRQGTTP